MKRIIGISGILLLTSCTNHLYQGALEYETTDNRICEAKIYSDDTTWFLNKNGKPDTITIKQGGDNDSFQFDYSPTDTASLVKPAEFYVAAFDPDQANISDSQVLCGNLTGFESYKNGENSEVEFLYVCNKMNLWGTTISGPMPASETPYVFKMQDPVSEFSWTGEQLSQRVELPTCRPKED
ncbi:hypothetical protein [Glaciecola sp. 1036]|uniref:hypothetical protein n=1 Tax=Alteromonadaceae TaxID=72275 RepID=UPI003D04B44A